MKYYYSKKNKGIFHYFKNSKKLYGFRITYFDNQHKRHEKSKRGFTNSKDAINIWRKIKLQLQDPTIIASSKSLGYWCKLFLNSIKNNIGYNRSDQDTISTYKTYKNRLNHDVMPYISKIKVNHITPQIYRRKCLNVLINQKHLRHKTVMNINTCLKTLLNFVVDNGGLKRNPLMEVEPPRKYVSPERKQMSIKQLHWFNQVLNKQNITDKVIFYTLEDTGMRAGELLGLKYSDIDTTKNTINIHHTRDNNGLRPPKTKSSIRKIPVTQSLIQLIERYYKYCSARWNINQDSFIILSSRGNPITPSLVPRKLKQLLIKCGFTDLVGKFVCHSFRHMFASRLLTAKYSVLSVARYLGHSNPDTTLKFYARALPGKIENLSAALSNLDNR